MAEIDYKTLGQRIRNARKMNNMTQEKLAEICSLSTAHIGHIERGTRIPSLDTVFKISSELSVSIDRLLFDSEDNISVVLSSISRSFEGKNDTQKKIFLTTIKALADKLDEM